MPEEIKKIIPNHVALIMDGNRRWAKERNLPAAEGHLRGYGAAKKAPEWLFNRGVKVVSLFTFSTENWTRGREEVNFIMKLAEKAFKDDLDEYNRKGYKLLISGRIEELPGDLPEICREAMDKTQANKGGILQVCLNYGGRQEIVDAIRKMMANNLKPEQVHEGMVKKYLYHEEAGDPDMIVRTSGEQRLSGFLLWQSAYSEFMALEKYWPDFEKIDVETILDEYAKRQRRFGGD